MDFWCTHSFIYYSGSRNIRYGSIRAEKKSALCCTCCRSRLALMAERPHMPRASRMRAGGRREGWSCPRRAVPARCFSISLWFACARPNSFSVKKNPSSVSHEAPHLLNKAFNRERTRRHYPVSLWCNKQLGLDHGSGTGCCPYSRWFAYSTPFVNAPCGSIHGSSWHARSYRGVTAIFKSVQ